MSESQAKGRCRITVAMIVRNEADVLEQSLESAAALADDLLVVDTGSTDATREVAARRGARVVEHVWADDFAAARNFALREAQGDWILWLDAGERLADGSAAKLRDFIDTAARCDSVYSILIELESTDPSCSGEQIAAPRLMPRRPELTFVGRVRETLLPAAATAGITLALAPGLIERHRRDHEPQRRLARARRNLALAEREMAEIGVRAARPLLAAAEALSELGRAEQALKTYEEAENAAEPGSSEQIEAHYGRLAVLATEPNCGDALLDACLHALEQFPLDAQLLLTLGNVMQQRNRLALAARSFDMAVKFGRVDLSTWHLAELPEVSVVCLAVVLQLQGRESDAEQILTEALAKSDSPRLLRALVDLYVKQNRRSEALAAADRLPVADDEIGPLHEAVQGACDASAGDWTSALAHLQIAYLSGSRHPLCLRWLVTTYLANGQIDAAYPVLLEWLQAEPSNGEAKAYLASLREAGLEVGIAPAATSATLTEADAAEADSGMKLRVDPPQGLPATLPPAPIDIPSSFAS